ncbi:hypothetical protein FHS85_004481 [Rhodoligotrophos appendicifer]|uniref:hypothetical protein n=1 Tax=Rhodoligotrophos appendicifer TaxID=987056 RepID=UPI0011870137|nr:hypothetical protein [Rhodoligotrophos appendicifer]
MPKHLMISVDWFGPYATAESAHVAAKADYEDGLYMCIGCCDQQTQAQLQYIGISTLLYKRVRIGRLHFKKIISDHQFWLGEITTAEPPGKKIKVSKSTLKYAEWLHARFLNLPFNVMKTKTIPDRSVTVLNRWFDTTYDNISERPHPDWPDLIDFPSYGLPARAVWFGSRQEIFSAPAYRLNDGR